MILLFICHIYPLLIHNKLSFNGFKSWYLHCIIHFIHCIDTIDKNVALHNK